MITAVDSNVLLDVFTGDPTLGPRSRAAIQRASGEGSLIVCEVVWAEVTASFGNATPAREAMERIGVRFSPMGERAASLAGQAWRTYRKQGGTRARLIPDFLIGAHAMAAADRLLTRDRGFYRIYFKELGILDPTA